MKKINIFYWICTGILTIALGIGSVLGLLSHPDAVKSVTSLGYPQYIAPFLDIARLLGLAVILVPHKYPRLKEWAYAGLAFDLAGALYSNIATGNSMANMIAIIVPVLFLSGSYMLYHKRITLVKVRKH